MNRKLFIIIIIIMISFTSTVLADETSDHMIDEQYDKLEMYKIKDFTNEIINNETREIFPDFDIDKIINDLSKGNSKPNITSLFKRILRYFMKEVYLNIVIMLKLIALAIICGLLTNLQSAFDKKGVSDVAFITCYTFLIGIAVKSFTYSINIGKDVIDNMVIFMQSMVPTLSTLLVSTGNITSASIFQPVVLFSVQFIGLIIKNFLIPLLFFSTVLSIVNNISNEIKVLKLANFIKKVIKWTLCLLLTIFIGVISVQGIASSAVDGVGSKTAKFAIGSFIPIIGGILSDAVDTVIGCSLILKNAVGILGLIIVIVICSIPLIKMGALIIIYRITEAVIEPVSDKRIVSCIGEFGDSLSMIFAMVLSVAIMFFLSITIVVCAGNISAMYR